MSALANMPDMHSSIYSIMQDNLKSELKYYPVLGFSDAGFFSKKTLGLCHKTHKTLIIQNFALQSGLRPPHLSLWFTGQSILLRKTVYCQNFATQNGLLSKFCYAKPPIQNFASQSGLRPPHLSSELCFAKLPTAAASFFAVHWSKHFATQNGLRPPRFLRGAYLHGQ